MHIVEYFHEMHILVGVCIFSIYKCIIKETLLKNGLIVKNKKKKLAPLFGPLMHICNIQQIFDLNAFESA